MTDGGAGAGRFADVPRAERPASPGVDYGVPAEGGELMPWSFVEERLAAARTYWIASVRPDGRPHAMPVWGVYLEADLYLETSPRTRKARNIASSPLVSVHLELGDEAVIVDGMALDVRPERSLGARLAAAFAAKYEGYDPKPDSWDGGGLYAVQPHTVFAWRDMPTATRWRFTAAPE
jgi:nitroimidazol reductase NimA-like FMN-containing flavoprotein (pyridoxamine 5'-phosphate oxidase superfamily)